MKTSEQPLPLPALLSHALVAFTIELDNEFERQMPHRTTNHGASVGGGPWLVSMAMYLNCMQFVGADGVRANELEHLARTPTNLNGMERWGYIVVEPDPADKRPKPPRSSWLIHATAKGRRAREVWEPLFEATEKRWRNRFGGDEIERLRNLLQALVEQLDPGLPDCLPILGYGLFSAGSDPKLRPVERRETRFKLPALLSRPLSAFAQEFERESALSLAICANVIRILDEDGVPVRDLPQRSGVSKEAIAVALGYLQKRGFATMTSVGRGKAARVTPMGIAAQSAYRQLASTIEDRWKTRFGATLVRDLRESLAQLAGDGSSSSPLFLGLDPYPDGWRASVPKPATLPHYPMVLHRGGFPDGS